MALTDKLTAIANVIRAKSGKTELMSLQQMAEEIGALSAQEIISHVSIPDYVKAEALRVATLVENVRKEDSIVFLSMSDSHHCGEQSDTSWQTNTNIGNLHSAQAAKILSYALKMDFVCHLGDITFGHGTTTSALLHHQLKEITDYLDESQRGIPTFMSVGNHDTGMYAMSNGTESSTESAEYLFSVFGARCEGATYGSTKFGYCHRDFNDKKLRVICLNSSEREIESGYGASPTMSQQQLLWFAQKLYEVGGNSGWSVMVLSHYPLDFYNVYPASDVVKAYVEGNSITLNGTAVNFNGHNSAKFVANFHGHTHCFKYAKLNQVSSSKAYEYDAWRVATPNAGFYRSNHQEGPDDNGITFNDSQTWDKSIGGAEDTAFVVNVVNPSEEVIHSFTYGAGPEERIIGYGATLYHTVTHNVFNASVENKASSTEDGKPYSTAIIPDEHCTVTLVTVTMNGIDITSSVYADGNIYIPTVTGVVVITVKAIIALACTNQIPISTDANGNIYGVDIDGNGVADGYKTNIYLGSGGGDSTATAKFTTGFIPVKPGDIIRFKNFDFISTEGNDRIAFYDSSKNWICNMKANSSWYMGKLNGVLDGIKYIQFTLAELADNTGFAYVRFSCSKISAESILTVNEEIRYADEVGEMLPVVNTLTNVTNNNPATIIEEGTSYTATLIVRSDCELKSVTVTMDGKDVTSEVYNNGLITIPNVTGSLSITAVAELIVVSYTNQIPISTDYDGSVYNGKGFKEDTYLTTGNTDIGTKAGYCATGFIPAKVGDTLYFKNMEMKQDSTGYNRLSFFKDDKTLISLIKTNNTDFTGFTFDSQGYLVSLRIPGGSSTNGTAFIRFSCPRIDESSIITINETIG